ncbi:hypothetical protein A2U01_0114206, partial [Trifolium medium]|nr:hypothetical protein [Trifolium medium]
MISVNISSIFRSGGGDGGGVVIGQGQLAL